MSYTPQPNTNIWKLYQALTTEFQSIKELTAKIVSRFPDFPKGSQSNHLQFLVDKKLVERRMVDNFYHYRLINNQPKQEILSLPKDTLTNQYLEYIKSRVGETVTAKQICSHFHRPEKDSAPATILGRLQLMGGIQVIENTKPYQYLVLPEMEKIEKVNWNRNLKTGQVVKKQPQEPHKNIDNMTIGEMLTSYMSLKEENMRLRSVLRRLAAELMSEIELN